MAAKLERDLRGELTRVLNELAGDGHDRLHWDYTVLLAYCGDTESLAAARQIAVQGSYDAELRIQALQALLFLDTRDSVRAIIERLLTTSDPPDSAPFRGKVLDSLTEAHDAGVAPIVLGAFAKLPAELKPRAVELFTERPAWSMALLAAVEAKHIPTSALNVNQLRRLQKGRDPEVARRVKAIWGTIREGRNPQRERLVSHMRQLIRSTPGDPIAGQVVYNKLCAECHKIHGVGQEVGPDITLNGRNDFEQLLSNVFDPSLVIGPGYHATTVAASDGRVLTGLLAEDGPERVVLKIQGGKIETIPRGQIDEIKTSPLSLMPDEIEKQLPPQEIADLFAFLCLDKPPSDPAAKPLPGAGPIRGH